MNILMIKWNEKNEAEKQAILDIINLEIKQNVKISINEVEKILKMDSKKSKPIKKFVLMSLLENLR